VSARTEQLARAERDRGAAEHCTRCGGKCACQTEFPGSYRCQVCRFIAEHPEGLAEHLRETHREQEGSQVNTEIRQFTNRDGDVVLCMTETELRLEEDTMDHVSFAEGRREVRRFVESHPELFNGSVEVDGVTDPGLAEYLFLVASVRDACHAAARDVAARFNLDFRKREDYAEAYKILAEEDPSWSAARFDDLSAAAQDRVVSAARRRMRTHTHGSHYGRPAVLGYRPAMLDQHHQARAEEMVHQAKKHGLDLTTHDGRRAAYQHAIDERPHLKIPQGRGRTNATDLRHLGIMPVAGGKMDDQFGGPSYVLRRGQLPTGEPSSPPGTNPYATVKPFPPPKYSEQPEWRDYSRPKSSPDNGTSGAGGLGGANY
jgi:hypothetical protein